MKLEWKYGRSIVHFDVPDRNVASILQPRDLEPVLNEGQAIAEAIQKPIGGEDMSKIVNSESDVAIIVSDITRPCPSYKVVPLLTKKLGECGVQKSNITILFATGMHRGHSKEEQTILVGQETAGSFGLVDHDCHNADNLVELGKTKRGTPISVNRLAVDADVKIGVANLDVHYFAGYSGGAKSVVPGVAGYETIRRNHSLMLQPGAEAGKVKDNPVREDLEEAVEMAGLDFIVNLVLNDNKNIVRVVAGDYVEAQRSGIAPNDYMYKAAIPERADIVIATAGGYPKDINLYQAQKGLENAGHAVRQDGTIILFADCSEGLGDKTFESWLMESDSPESVMMRLKEDFMLGGHKAFAIAKLAKRAHIVLVSNLPSDLVRKAFMTPASSAKNALTQAFEREGRDARVILMPYAGSTLPHSEK